MSAIDPRPVYLIYRRHDDMAEIVHKEYSEADAAEFCRAMNEKWENLGWYYSYELKPTPANPTQLEK